MVANQKLTHQIMWSTNKSNFTKSTIKHF